MEWLKKQISLNYSLFPYSFVHSLIVIQLYLRVGVVPSLLLRSAPTRVHFIR